MPEGEQVERGLNASVSCHQGFHSDCIMRGCSCKCHAASTPEAGDQEVAPLGPQGGREIDWNNDEAVVKAAWGLVTRNSHPNGWIYGDGLMTNALGRSWPEARNHESVQGFERECRPAALPDEEEK